MVQKTPGSKTSRKRHDIRDIIMPTRFRNERGREEHHNRPLLVNVNAPSRVKR